MGVEAPTLIALRGIEANDVSDDEVVQAVEAAVASGVTKTEAFDLIAKQTGSTSSKIMVAYYRAKRDAVGEEVPTSGEQVSDVEAAQRWLERRSAPGEHSIGSVGGRQLIFETLANAELLLDSGIIVITDFGIHDEALLGDAPSLPRKSGESASVGGERFPIGVLLNTGKKGARATVHRVIGPQHGWQIGWLVWLADRGLPTLSSQEGIVETHASGAFSVESGEFTIVDQQDLRNDPGIAEDLRFDGGGFDGAYDTWVIYKDREIVGVFAGWEDPITAPEWMTD